MSEVDKLQELVREQYRAAESASWDLEPETVRAQRRRRSLPAIDAKALVLIAAAVVLIVGGLLAFGRTPTHHSINSSSSSTTTTTSSSGTSATPNLVGLSQAAAAEELGSAGFNVGAITLEPSSIFPVGTVSASDPRSGSLLPAGATVALVVSSGPPSGGSTTGTSPPVTSVPSQSTTVTPTTAAVASNCASGATSFTMTAASASTCIHVGTTLTVTFNSPGGWSSYGQWSSSPPSISNASILSGGSYVPSGKSASLVLNALAAGTTGVTAAFDNRCAPSDTTPCTIPPGSFLTLTVYVVPA